MRVDCGCHWYQSLRVSNCKLPPCDGDRMPICAAVLEGRKESLSLLCVVFSVESLVGGSVGCVMRSAVSWRFAASYVCRCTAHQQYWKRLCLGPQGKKSQLEAVGNVIQVYLTSITVTHSGGTACFRVPLQWELQRFVFLLLCVCVVLAISPRFCLNSRCSVSSVTCEGRLHFFLRHAHTTPRRQPWFSCVRCARGLEAREYAHYNSAVPPAA